MRQEQEQAPQPERQSRWWEPWPLVLAASFLGFVVGPPSSPLSEILRQYALQLRAGNGPVLNPGEHVLLVASPGYIVFLALTTPNLLFFCALAVGSISLYHIARQAGLSRSAWAAAGLYLAAWPLWIVADTAFPMMSALGLLALLCALRTRWQLAGLAASIAILCGPEAIVLALVLLLLAVERKAGWRFGLTLFLPVALTLVAMRWYYGSTLWEGLLINAPLSSSSLNLYVASSIPLLALAVSAWYRQRANLLVAFCGAWIAAYLLITVGLLRQSIDGQYAPIAGPTIILIFIGLRERFGSLGLVWRVAGAFAVWFGVLIPLILFLSPGDPLPWSRPIVPEQARTVGVHSAFLAMELRHSPDQVMVAFDGKLQPELRKMLERGDEQSALIRYAPDWLVNDDSTGVSFEALAKKTAWVRLGYVPVGETKNSFQRKTVIGQFIDQPVSAAFGPDIRLVGAALDQPALKPGQVVRVRLDWEFARPATRPVTVELRLAGTDGEVATAVDEYEPRVFRAGTWSTYHTLIVAPDAASGPAQLFVSVMVNNGTVARQVVAKIEIKP